MSFEDEEIVLVANALIFFFAGFDTTSLGLGMACHKLCIYEESNVTFVLSKNKLKGSLTKHIYTKIMIIFSF